jgi:hypothetical protein
MAMYLLHGTLDATIYEAENLINVERSTGNAPALFRQVGIHSVWVCLDHFKLSTIPVCQIISQELLPCMSAGFQSYGSLEDLQGIDEGSVCVGLYVAVCGRG